MIWAMKRALRSTVCQPASPAFERLGVTTVLDRTVVGVRADAVTPQRRDGRTQRILARTVVRAAGVRASGVDEALGRASAASVDRARRVSVAPDLMLPAHRRCSRQRHGPRPRRRGPRALPGE
jgi:NADH dehydrogenase